MTSKREDLLSHMQTVFQNTVSGDSGGGTTFGRVLNSPPDGRELKGQTVLSIIEGNESYLEVVSPDKRDRALDVDLTVRAYIPRDTSLRAGANNVLADLEEIVEANSLWGGRAYATLFLANTIDREDTGDRVVEITLFISVRYRTRRSDPRTPAL